MERIGTRYKEFIGQGLTVCGTIWRENSVKQEFALNWFPLGTWTVLIVCLHCCFRRQKGWLMANAVIVRKLSSVEREAGGDYDDIIFVCTQTRLYDRLILGHLITVT